MKEAAGQTMLPRSVSGLASKHIPAEDAQASISA